MGMGCRISRSLLDAIRREAAAVSPLEACGLLYGAPDRIDDWDAVENIAEDPARRFEIAPAALFAALRAERGGGPRIVGYWHSHPGGDPRPSPTDAAMAQGDGKLWLIVAGDEARLWRAEPDGPVHGRFDEVPIAID